MTAEQSVFAPESSPESQYYAACEASIDAGNPTWICEDLKNREHYSLVYGHNIIGLIHKVDEDKFMAIGLVHNVHSEAGYMPLNYTPMNVLAAKSLVEQGIGYAAADSEVPDAVTIPLPQED